MQISINQRSIGPGQPPYLIAELSGNHNGDIGRAKALIDAAVDAGADAVKLQTYTADTITLDSARPEFLIQHGPWAGKRLYELYQWAHTPWDWHAALFEHARDRGITLFSSPFDATAVELLESLGAPAYKIASFELVDIALIRQVAATGKPVILSTGMASLEEISEAVQAARQAGCKELALLHCVSGYPAPAEDYHLHSIAELSRRFGVVAGLSDHTRDNTTAIASVALGASIVEKHLTLARADGGPDASFSLEPEEFKALCRQARTAYSALGQSDHRPQASESDNRAFRRSLYFCRDMQAGETITAECIRSVRPGLGLAPKYLEQLIGRRVRQSVARHTPLAWELIDDD